MTTLSVWTDGNSWAVAASAEDALAATGMHEDDSPIKSWEALLPDEELAFAMSDDEPLMLPGEPWEQILDIGMRRQRATCARWVAEVAAGRLDAYLGSMDW